MKILRLAVAVIASLLFWTSCDKEEEGGTPKIIVRGTEVQLDSDGQAVNVVYVIENEVEGVKLAATTDAEWLVVNTSRARVLSVSAEPNESGEVRNAEVTLIYEGAESVVLHVTQDYYESPLKITVSGVTATGVTFSVTTTDPDLTWIPLVAYKQTFEYFETMDELVAYDLEYFDYLADINEMTRAEFLELMTVVGPMEDAKVDGLDPSNDYVLYAYGISMEGKRTTDVVYMPFRTDDPYEGDITFTFEAVEEDYILEYTITPSHTGVPFYYDIVTKDQMERWKLSHSNDIRAAIQAEVIDAEINELLSLDFIKGPEDYYAIYNESNVVDWGYHELKGSTTYVLYAVKWDEQCRLMGPVSTYEHTSADVDPSLNQITLEVRNVTQSSAEAVVTVTNDDPYAVIPIRRSEIANMTDEEIFEYVSTKYDYLLSEYTYSGDKTKTFSLMRPSTEYTMLAFGFKAATMTTSGIQKVDFITDSAGLPEDCTFEFKVTPDVDYAFVEIIPSDKGQFYKWLVCPVGYTAEDVKNWIAELIATYYEGDISVFSSWELTMGDEAENAWDLIENTEYKVAAVVMDYDTGEFLSEVAFSEPFTTLEKTYANLEFQFDYGPYYDLYEVVSAGQNQLTSMLSEADLIFPIKLKVKGDCKVFYYNIYQNDLSDEVLYPDEQFYGALEYGCTYASSYTYLRYYQTMTLVAVAYDYEDNVSKLYRDVLFFTPEGASPAEDFIASIKKSAAKLAAASAPAAVQPKAVSKKLPENRISPKELQMKHDEAMAKVNKMRRERYMKEIMQERARKERRIAREF